MYRFQTIIEFCNLKIKGKVYFFLPWSHLNLVFFLFEKQKEQVELGILFKAATYFESRKMEEGYWIGEHLLDQISKKILLIEEILYSDYKLLFIFDNATSHAVYAKDALQIENMNKSFNSQ